MRDPKRIKRIITKLEILWLRNPDQRLGQLMENHLFSPGSMFFMEDTDTEEMLDELVKDIVYEQSIP